MKHQKSEFYFLLILLTGIFVLAFFIFKPFLYPLILAVVFATVFGPVYRKILLAMGGRKNLSALLTTTLILVVVIVPIIYLSIQIFQEATRLYFSLTGSDGVNDFSLIITNALKDLSRFSPTPIDLSIDIKQYATQGLSWLLQHFGLLFASLAKVMVSIFIFLIALYYMFKDGYRLKKAVIALSPLENIHDEAIYSKVTTAINSVIRGSLTVALVQGILAAIGFYLFGVPNPVLWGSVATIAALVPSIGTFLVLFPAILYLYFTKDTISAAGLLIWGACAVGLVDNFLGPKLVERGMQIHPFLILLSILGGISFFGPIGFLLGPLVLSMLFALLEIYSIINKQHESQ